MIDSVFPGLGMAVISVASGIFETSPSRGFVGGHTTLLGLSVSNLGRWVVAKMGGKK